jgi:quinone-modifying oxidoreductase subunit QmoA
VAKISEESDTKDLILDVEDTLSGETLHPKFEMVILSTGIVPNTADMRIPFDLKVDDYGFVDGETDVAGVFAAGCAAHPCDVSRATRSSTAAVMKAIQCLNGGE